MQHQLVILLLQLSHSKTCETDEHTVSLHPVHADHTTVHGVTSYCDERNPLELVSVVVIEVRTETRTHNHMVMVVFHHIGRFIMGDGCWIIRIVTIHIHLHAVEAVHTTLCGDPDVVAGVFIDIGDAGIGKSLSGCIDRHILCFQFNCISKRQ